MAFHSTYSFVSSQCKLIYYCNYRKVYNHNHLTNVTKVTSVSSLTNTAPSLINMLRVHIAAVGFEVDRIVLPAIKNKADRVWLLTHSGLDKDKGDVFVSLIRERFRNAGIDCQQSTADRTDLFDILRALRSIIIKENGNSILVNVSVGSKIQAIASMMACMMFKDQIMIKPYYVIPEKYNTSSTEEMREETEGMKDTILLPEYKIEIPNERLIRCLNVINQQKDNKISKRELKDLALNNSLIRISNRQDSDDYTEQAAYMALNKNLIDPLLEWKFITVSKQGAHHIITLTDEGRNALKFLNVD